MSPTGAPGGERRGVIDLFRLDGKVVVITGASSGLGAAAAEILAEAGADVVVGARRAERLADTVQRIEGQGRRGFAVAMDVTRPEDCERLAQAAIDEFGRLDVLVNNAGIAGGVAATREPPQGFIDIVHVNLFGAYWMAQSAARRMPNGGSVVNVSSVLGLHPCDVPMAGYAASKAGLLGLTRELASQWTRRKGIRVNALAPGVFPSPMTEDERELKLERQLSKPSALGRPATLQEVCAPMLFLASDASSYITGTTVILDGGWSYS